MQSAPKISGSVEMSGSTSVSFMGHSPDQGVFGACSNRCGHVASWISQLVQGAGQKEEQGMEGVWQLMAMARAGLKMQSHLPRHTG